MNATPLCSHAQAGAGRVGSVATPQEVAMPPAQQHDEEPLDSARGWVAEHTRRYVETHGEEGHDWNGVPCLVLTTRGRRSGRWRRNALIYAQDGDRYIVVASKGGADEHPLW